VQSLFTGKLAEAAHEFTERAGRICSFRNGYEWQTRSFNKRRNDLTITRLASDTPGHGSNAMRKSGVSFRAKWKTLFRVG
jgi:hypothetical protein